MWVEPVAARPRTPQQLHAQRQISPLASVAASIGHELPFPGALRREPQLDENQCDAFASDCQSRSPRSSSRPTSAAAGVRQTFPFCVNDPFMPVPPKPTGRLQVVAQRSPRHPSPWGTSLSDIHGQSPFIGAARTLRHTLQETPAECSPDGTTCASSGKYGSSWPWR
jgi:hypothetical protein